jgi:anti-sigma regulatory factor (Ser/Thr protein kinase)
MALDTQTSFLKLHISCEYDAVRGTAGQVRSFLAEQKVGESDLWACELAFVEACNNVVRYTPASLYSEGVLVEIRRRDREIEFRINDRSTGFDLPAEIELPAPDQERGRGLYVIKSLMDRMEYVRGAAGNCLILTKRLRLQ